MHASVVPRFVPAVCLAFALSLVSAPAAAQLSLTWDAPVECPTEAAVRAEVTRLLGGALPNELELDARGQATRDAEGRWTLQLRTTMHGVDGQRALEGDGCESLGDAAALILALMIDPSAVAENTVVSEEGASPETDAQTRLETSPETRAAEPESVPREAPTPVRHVVEAELSDPVETPPPTRERGDGGVVSRVVEHGDAASAARADEAVPSDPASDERLAGFIGLGGAFDIGGAPAPTGAVSIEGGFGVPLVDARLRATFVVGQDANRGAGVGATISTGMLDARACFHPFEVFRALYGCVGLGLGVSVAEGFGLSGSETGVGTFAAGVAGLGLAWSPEPWFDLEVDATLLVPFNPLEFAVRGSPDDVFHEQEPLAGRFGLSAHVRF